MKVLQVINTLITGGAEKLILDIVPLLNQSGVQTDVLVFNDKGYPFFKTLKELKCCEIYNFEKSSVYNPLSILKLTSIIKQYDVVHVHLFPANYFTVIAKLISFSKTKLIYTEHSTSNNRMSNKMYHFIDKNIYKGFNKVICISDEIKTILKDYTNLSENAFTVIENGIQLSKIYDAQPLSRSEIDSRIKKDDTLILQVSSFQSPKDQPTLIRAMQHLPSNFKLLLVGSGIRLEEDMQIAKDLNLEDKVYFLGIRTDVPRLLKTVNYTVLSSRHEGLSLSSLEGMASGVPFLCTEVPGLVDVVKGAGVMFPYKDDKAFATCISRLENNKEHYNNVVTKCQERASKYDISNMINSLITVYKEVLN